MELLFKCATVNGVTVAPEFNKFKREVMKPRKEGKQND